VKVTAGRATSTTRAMPTNQPQPSANSRSGGVLLTSVTTRPMNQGTALSLSATKSSTTNKAANSHLAWRAKCQRKASRLGGGSGCSGAAVGVRNRSKRDNILLLVTGRHRSASIGPAQALPCMPRNSTDMGATAASRQEC
jgi:hypothetical protein